VRPDSEELLAVADLSNKSSVFNSHNISQLPYSPVGSLFFTVRPGDVFPGRQSESNGYEYRLGFEPKVVTVKRQDDKPVFRSSLSEVGTLAPKNSSKFDTYFHEFRRVARSEILEYGTSSNSDNLIEKWSKQHDFDFGGVLNHIFIKAVGNKNLQLALLKAVSSIAYESVYPHAQVQAMAALVIKDFEVAEAGIRAFENWGHKDGVHILENSVMAAAWLDDYRKQTITYLKEL